MFMSNLVGSNDLPRAIAFYDKLFAQLGLKEVVQFDHLKFWKGEEGAMFGVCTPNNKQAATPGNGCMPAFKAKSTEEVERIFAYALELGATKDGELSEGVLEDGTIQFYGQYFRDLDGNRLAVFYSDVF